MLYRNRIKKRLTAIFGIVAILLAQTIRASDDSLVQKPNHRWFVQLSGGYGLPFAQEYIGYDDHYNAQNALTRTIKKGSLGQGILNTISIGYQLTDHIGIEMGTFANWGTEIRTGHYSSEVFPDNYDDVFQKVNTGGLLTGFNFAENFSHVHLGLHNYLMCGLYNKGYQRNHYGDANDESTWVIENTEGVSVGWLSKLSIDYYFTDQFSVGAEGFIKLYTWRPKHGEIIEATYNGQDGVQYMSDEDRNFTYPESFGSAPTNPNVFAVAFTYPLHAAGAGIRIQYSF